MWKKEYEKLGAKEGSNYVQIFENKRAIIGCSNPHSHRQIWSKSSVPTEILMKSIKFKEYWEENASSLLLDYLEQKLKAGERILEEDEHFVALIPYLVVWPFEAMIIPRRHLQHIGQLNAKEEKAYV